MSSEQYNADSRARIDNVEAELRELKNNIKEILALMSEMNADVKVLRATACPNPGMCVKLDPVVTSLENRLRNIENEEQQLIGAKTIIGFACLFVGWAVSNLISWFHK